MAAWIEKRSGSITVRWKRRGRFGRRKVPDTKTARILIRQIETAHALGHDWQGPDQSPQAHEDLIDLFTAALVRLKRIRAASTVRSTQSACAVYVDFLRVSRPRGRLWLTGLSEQNLSDFFCWLQEHRGNLPQSAAVTTLKVVAIWRWASTSEAWAHVVPPFVAVDLGSPPLSELRRAPTWGECDRMIEALAGGEKWRRVAVLMRMTGVRRAQAERLEWRDFDFDACTLRIRPALGKTRLEKRGRIVPVAPPLLEAMAGWGARQGRAIGPTPATASGAYRRLTAAWRASGIEHDTWKGQPCHSLRRAFCSELASRGADRWAIEILCGRSTGLGGNIYIDPMFIWGKLVDAVGMVSGVGLADTSPLARRSFQP